MGFKYIRALCVSLDTEALNYVFFKFCIIKKYRLFSCESKKQFSVRIPSTIFLQDGDSGVEWIIPSTETHIAGCYPVQKSPCQQSYTKICLLVISIHLY